jgi:hypothetical protein
LGERYLRICIIIHFSSIFLIFLTESGAYVRGARSRNKTHIINDLSISATPLSENHIRSPEINTPQPQTPLKHSKEQERRADDKCVDIWPLDLIDLDDPEQTTVVYNLFRVSPHVIAYYLFYIIFPEVMQHQGMKISACEQEVCLLMR